MQKLSSYLKNKPIFYSLGNFLFNSKEGYDYRATNRPHWYEGLCVVLTIDKGKLSWEVVNTRNIDNVGLVIDRDKGRNIHNEQICNYLKDNLAYIRYLNPIQTQKAKGELRSIERMFKPRSLKEAIKLLWGCFRGVKPKSKDELLFMLKNDLRRTRMTNLIKSLI